jgi:hypothetical protein
VATEKQKPIRYEQQVPGLPSSSIFKTEDFWQCRVQNADIQSFIEKEKQVVPAIFLILLLVEFSGFNENID